MSLITTDMVLLEIGRSSRTDDAEATDWIKQRIAMVSEELASDRWCSQRLEYGTQIYEFQTIVTLGRKHLPYHPVYSIDTLEYYNDQYVWSAIEIDPGVLAIDNGIHYLDYDDAVYSGMTYRLALTMGYWPADSDQDAIPEGVLPVPAGLKRVALDMVAYDYEQRFGARRGLKTETLTSDGLTRSFVSREEKEREWRRGLQPFRLRSYF